MPRYKYLCSHCGLEFEQLRSSTQRENCPCPSCKEEADKQVSGSNFTFQHTPTGPIPQNTGVAGIDYNYDRVIGRDAEQKWEVIHKRRDVKIATAVEERRSGRDVHMDHLTPTGDGSYRTLTQQEIDKVNVNRSLAEDYNKQLSAQLKKDKH